jgi:hypothetical protein
MKPAWAAEVRSKPLSEQDDSDALGRWNPTAMGRSDDDPVDRHFEQFSAVQEGSSVPCFRALVMVEQDTQIEGRRMKRAARNRERSTTLCHRVKGGCSPSLRRMLPLPRHSDSLNGGISLRESRRLATNYLSLIHSHLIELAWR